MSRPSTVLAQVAARAPAARRRRARADRDAVPRSTARSRRSRPSRARACARSAISSAVERSRRHAKPAPPIVGCDRPIIAPPVDVGACRRIHETDAAACPRAPPQPEMKPLPEVRVRVGANRDANVVGAIGGDDFDRAGIESAADLKLFWHGRNALATVSQGRERRAYATIDSHRAQRFKHEEVDNEQHCRAAVRFRFTRLVARAPRIRIDSPGARRNGLARRAARRVRSEQAAQAPAPPRRAGDRRFLA